MRRVSIIAAMTAALLAGCGGDGGYSEAFRTSFMESCVDSSGGQTAYCQCALDHLEANGPEDETDISAEDQQAAIEACQSEVTS
jgi:hypothetical protein